MRYPFEIVKLSGLNTDLPPTELAKDIYSAAKNVRYDRLGMSRVSGHSKVFATGMLHAPYHVIGIKQPLNYFWIYPGASAVGAVDPAGTHSDITPAAGVTASYDENWTSGQINGVPYLVNPNQDPIYWDGIVTNPMVTFPNWPANTKAKVIRTYNNFLIALNVTKSSVDYPSLVKWSSSAPAGSIPNSWDETDPTLDAGEITLAGTDGDLVDCLPLYDDNIVYKNNSTYAMTYNGGQSVFSFREIFHETGIMAKNCATQFEGHHCVMTRDDVIVHDGQTQQSILDKRMRNWLFSTLNYEEAGKSFVVANHRRDEIWICFPDGGAGANGLPNMAIIWNYRDNKLGVRDLPDSPFIGAGTISQFNGITDWTDTGTWDSDTSVWNESLIGSVSQDLVMCSGSNLYQLDIGNQFDTTDYQSYVERTGLPLSDSYTEMKLVRALWPTITGTTGTVLKIRVGMQMHPDDPISWSSEGNYTIGTNDRFDTFAKGRLISFRISSDSGATWKLDGIAIETKKGGRW